MDVAGYQQKETRLQKILCGVQGVTAETKLEKAVKYAVDNAGSGGGGGGAGAVVVTLTEDSDVWSADMTAAEIKEVFEADIPIYIAAENFMMPVLSVVEDEGAIRVGAGGTAIMRNSQNGTYNAAYGAAMYIDDTWHVDTDGKPIAVTDCTPFVVHGTFGLDGSNNVTVTLDCTAAELFANCKTGRKANLQFTKNDEAYDVVCDIAAIKTGTGNTAKYSFRTETDDEYKVSALSANDTVVLAAQSN